MVSGGIWVWEKILSVALCLDQMEDPTLRALAEQDYVKCMSQLFDNLQLKLFVDFLSQMLGGGHRKCALMSPEVLEAIKRDHNKNSWEEIEWSFHVLDGPKLREFFGDEYDSVLCALMYFDNRKYQSDQTVRTTDAERGFEIAKWMRDPAHHQFQQNLSAVKEKILNEMVLVLTLFYYKVLTPNSLIKSSLTLC